MLLANGVSLKEIQEWLGHSHYSTTANIYAHLDYSSKISSAQVMSSTLQIPNMQKAPESPKKEIQELIHF
ncbi:tyrosine-type recombinase/integrase [Brevibacillus parabrevis]|uniref:tyrosine-type recombinase/integrase n=1 Tax=Brevibacillus parabrevis TaxID=54914 RepID=UPI002E22AB53|nr:tyrosine-type recombinase/integrase [Brevibacillus parabrevis]MED2254386.1 tyrosine-type recombinase/integrase [Brevibacillus parabrevis]